MLLKEKIIKNLEDRYHEMQNIRRHLHKNPELSFEEEATSKYIKDFYKDKNVDIVDVEGRTGFGVRIQQSEKFPTLALRADFDALAIQEETNLEFASVNDGIMHACGHDAHTAYLMILADELIKHREELSVNFLIIHQHAEEKHPGGAIDFINQGLIDEVDLFLGAHVIPYYNAGTFIYKPGVMFAGSDTVDIEFLGRSSHASMPHLGNDAILAASDFTCKVHTIINKNLDPFEAAVINVGSFNGSGSSNIVQNKVDLSLSVRYLDNAAKYIIKSKIEELLLSMEVFYNVKTNMTYSEGYPPLVNNEYLTKIITEHLNESKPKFVDKLVIMDSPVMGSEDFSRYSLLKPSLFIYFCASNGVDEVNHSPKFEIDEMGMLKVSQLMVEIIDFLDKNPRQLEKLIGG